jgi:hypothetical protein
MPILTKDELKKLAPIGLYAACAHGGSVLAMGAPGAGKKKKKNKINYSLHTCQTQLIFKPLH